MVGRAVIAAAIDPALAIAVASVLVLLIAMFAVAAIAVWVGQKRQVKNTISTFGLSKAADMGADSEWWETTGASAVGEQKIIPPWMDHGTISEDQASSSPIYVDAPRTATALADPNAPVDWSAPPAPKADPAPKRASKPKIDVAPAPKQVPMPPPLDLSSVPTASTDFLGLSPTTPEASVPTNPSVPTTPPAGSSPKVETPAPLPAQEPEVPPTIAPPPSEGRVRGARSVPSTFGPPKPKSDA